MFTLKAITGLVLIFVIACVVNLRVTRLDTSAQVAALPDIGQDTDAYLAARESAYDDITEGTQKQVVWAGADGAETDLAIIYVHGFSASRGEIEPVSSEVAKAFNANVYFTRLTGHGRPGAHMATATAEDWVADLAEAMAIGRKIGKRLVLITTSTGGTLATVGHLYPRLMSDVEGIVFVSPNYQPASPASIVGRLPFVRQWAPILFKNERSWEPENEQQAKFWTTSYAPVSIVPMMRLVGAVERMDLGQVKTPALFYYTQEDKVVKASATDAVVERWGGPKEVAKVKLAAGDDPSSHVIAGDIMSPVQTPKAIDAITNWIRSLE